MLWAKLELLDTILLALDNVDSIDELKEKLQQLYIDYNEELRVLRFKIDETLKRLIINKNKTTHSQVLQTMIQCAKLKC